MKSLTQSDIPHVCQNFSCSFQRGGVLQVLLLYPGCLLHYFSPPQINIIFSVFNNKSTKLSSLLPIIILIHFYFLFLIHDYFLVHNFPYRNLSPTSICRKSLLLTIRLTLIFIPSFILILILILTPSSIPPPL